MTRPYSHRVRIRQSAIDAIAAHAARESPSECCGVLLGRGDEIHSAKPVRNRLRDPARFDADPLELLRVERQAQQAESSVLGYYHSHPSDDPCPSAIDREHLPWPDLPPHYHLIISPDRGWALYDTREGAWSLVEVDVLAPPDSPESDRG